MSLRLGLTCALLFAAPACSNRGAFEPLSHELTDGAGVRITTMAHTYAPGAIVGLRVENQSDIEYIWNPCFRTLERSTETGWTPADEGNRVCTAEGWILKPGNHTDATTELPRELPSGDYRLRYGFSRPEGNINVSDFQVSNTFRVTQ